VEDGAVHLHVRGVAPGLRFLRGTGPRLLATAASCRWHARRLGRFDVVETPEWQAIGAGFCLARRTPVVVSLQTPTAVIHAHDPREGGRPRSIDVLERMVVRRADGITSLSQLLVDELHRTGWLDPARAVRVAPPVVDLAEWATVPDAAPTDPVVLGIGRLEPRKGFSALLAAAAAIDDVPGLRVELAGGDTAPGRTGSWAAELRREADRLGVDLRLHGALSHDGLREVVAGARVVALPSTFDSFNMAGLEALAAGRPVVVSDRVGLGELVDGGDALTVVPVGAIDELAEALAVHLRDGDRAAAAGGAARRLAARWGAAAFADDRARCYREVIAQRSS
jgi:glycogen(starch) synthase